MKLWNMGKDIGLLLGPGAIPLWGGFIFLVPSTAVPVFDQTDFFRVFFCFVRTFFWFCNTCNHLVLLICLCSSASAVLLFLFRTSLKTATKPAGFRHHLVLAVIQTSTTPGLAWSAS